MPTLPTRETLRREFDTAVREIDQSRQPDSNLFSEFYARIGDSVFEAGYSALTDSCGNDIERHTRWHVVSAPVGSGKTSFSLAFMAAVVRLSETDGEAPFGCVYLVDQMPKADGIYLDLQRLLPGRVAIWTTDHDVNGKLSENTKVREPAARFAKDDLEKFPVAVVTHAFYSGRGGHKARYVNCNGLAQPRALTLIDEQPNEVTVFDVEMSAAHRVREAIQQDDEHADIVGPHMDELLQFMNGRDFSRGANLEKPSDNHEAWAVADRLRWFASHEAVDYVRARSGVTDLVPVFGFAKALANGYAFIARNHGGARGTYFIGYENNMTLVPGTVLLDATADIDGVSQLCPWREHKEVPQARYNNLNIAHVPAHTKRRLSNYLKSAMNRRAYVDWMVQTIKEHMVPGQRGLVVCKKTLFDNENVPNWPQGDARHKHLKIYTEDYGWELEGRLLCATHWGTGIGANTWQNADVVFLFDEFFKPRRTVIATAQGLRQQKATEGPLSKMKTLNGKANAVDTLEEGHLLRWTKQMALRGRGRRFDERGVCGHQKLVFSGDLKRLLGHADKLFPGAKVATINTNHGGHEPRATALLGILGRPGLPTELSTRWLSQQMHVPWRDVSKNVMIKEWVQKALQHLGWTYVSRKGRGGACFRRTAAALQPT